MIKGKIFLGTSGLILLCKIWEGNCPPTVFISVHLFWVHLSWNDLHLVNKCVNNLRLIYYIILFTNTAPDGQVLVSFFLRKLQLNTELCIYYCISFSLNLDQEASLLIIFHHSIINGLMSKWIKQIAYLLYVGNWEKHFYNYRCIIKK